MSTREMTIYAPEGLVAGGDIKGESFQYLNLATGEKLPVADMKSAYHENWHIAFKRSVICVNGGVAGPGGILGACVIHPPDVPREEFLKLTDDDFKSMFAEVTKIPEGLELLPEGIEPAIFDWRVLKDDKWTANSVKGWKLRLADGASFAKMRVKNVAGDSVTITIQCAFQPAKGAPLEPDRTAQLAPGDHFSFRQGKAVSSDEADWDIRHGGGALFLNSSVSGPGKAGAIGSNKYGAQWKTVENPSDSIAYFMDEYGSIFRHPKWYRYNIDGKHNIHPNGAVYVLRAADGDYKVQVYDYFEHKGSDLGNIRIRFAKL
ncbi:MAG: HmuY family protein [Nitrospinae bacterium]|nr:HmuY family protein [Nitrospinota bacterium]